MRSPLQARCLQAACGRGPMPSVASRSTRTAWARPDPRRRPQTAARLSATTSPGSDQPGSDQPGQAQLVEECAQAAVLIAQGGDQRLPLILAAEAMIEVACAAEVPRCAGIAPAPTQFDQACRLALVETQRLVRARGLRRPRHTHRQ